MEVQCAAASHYHFFLEIISHIHILGLYLEEAELSDTWTVTCCVDVKVIHF